MRVLLLALSTVISRCCTGVLCTFPGHLRGEQLSLILRAGVRRGCGGTLNLGAAWGCRGRGSGFPTILTLILLLFFAWVGAVLWSWSFLTSRARRVCEVRKRKRNGLDGIQPGQRR